MSGSLNQAVDFHLQQQNFFMKRNKKGSGGNSAASPSPVAKHDPIMLKEL